MDRIYLDHAATTPLHPEAREAMLPWLADGFGNPSSLHSDGRLARQAVDQARETLSEALGCLFAEVVFTSSGTEACNLAIVGAALANEDPNRKVILLGAAEHHCVRHTREILEVIGYSVLTYPVDRLARPDLSTLKDLIREDVLLVSAMHANNELGTLSELAPIAQRTHEEGALFFTDAVQTFLTPEFDETSVSDMIAVAAHKVQGPKGVGALVVKAGTKIVPVLPGGGQERELRSGTENVTGIVGFAAAVRALNEDGGGLARQRAARDAFLDRLREANPPGLSLSTDHGGRVLSGHAHLRFEGCTAESMLIVLDRLGVSASSGAACSSGSLEPSHVLLACGYSEREAAEGLRFTFGRTTSLEEAKEAADRVLSAADQVRSAKAGAIPRSAES